MEHLPSNQNVKDVVGIGLGPSNLALAVAVDEQGGNENEWLFLERNKECMWHPGMLLEGARLQISFLKDLVTLRNPRSFFSFINYLKENGRLDEFINLSHFNPTRIEYVHYLNWVRRHLPQHMMQMGAEVINVAPIAGSNGDVNRLQTVYRNKDGEVNSVMSKDIVIAVGGTPFIPEPFTKSSVKPIFHSSNFLHEITSFSSKKSHQFCVVGSGQSAVEIILYLADHFPDSTILSIQRNATFKPADNSPFVNEIFFPRNADFMFDLHNRHSRKRVMNFYHDTNYSAVDIDLLETLYHKIYDDKWRNQSQIQLCSYTDIVEVSEHGHKVNLLTRNNLTEEPLTNFEVDAVILATGYERKTMPSFMDSLLPYFVYEDDELVINRSYRVQTNAEMKSNIYLQGMSEMTHGISDTLLSILPIRANDILQDITNQFATNKEKIKEAVY
ncbi:SidA/IucD/PvdA family monooxygenase [Paenibacillus sp. SC116]|uniref:lysine N(6)-hydroxylase/L-ornithine N(5)-oxygenase family protein n=1 Tax=Paenibacillus sp. SC116 TaxID=2968986 RepID=UPI00215AC5B7|nr:SidA/IucD/PvdA family monooxygenase [Paenibacillus sp. SC116]MCR8842145.1 SidA/IucD/PvdA family monooxygenase [Paenibacillus sp. SC116]